MASLDLTLTILMTSKLILELIPPIVLGPLVALTPLEDLDPAAVGLRVGADVVTVGAGAVYL